MKKIVLLVLWFLFIFTITAHAAVPKFKVHRLDNLAPGVNYSINYPVVIDYDGDSDLDILIISKEGIIYFLENLRIE